MPFYLKTINANIKAILPAALADHILLAPPAYIHNSPHSIPMTNLNLKLNTLKETPKKGRNISLQIRVYFQTRHISTSLVDFPLISPPLFLAREFHPSTQAWSHDLLYL